MEKTHAFQAFGTRYDRTQRQHDATEHEERTAPPPLTDADRRADFNYARRSIGRTHGMMSDTLGVPCSRHDAARGVYCWHSPVSLVRGVCSSRIERGVRDATRVDHIPKPPNMIVVQYVARSVPRNALR